MHPTLIKLNMMPGDRIVEPKSGLRIVQHHSIYLGQDNYGTDWIIENKVGIGVRLITANAYFSGVYKVTRVQRFHGSPLDRKLAIQRALEEVGQPYDLINYNCEGFANYVQYGRNYSEQSQAGVAVGGFLAILILLGLASR